MVAYWTKWKRTSSTILATFLPLLNFDEFDDFLSLLMSVFKEGVSRKKRN